MKSKGIFITTVTFLLALMLISLTFAAFTNVTQSEQYLAESTSVFNTSSKHYNIDNIVEDLRSNVMGVTVETDNNSVCIIDLLPDPGFDGSYDKLGRFNSSMGALKEFFVTYPDALIIDFDLSVNTTDVGIPALNPIYSFVGSNPRLSDVNPLATDVFGYDLNILLDNHDFNKVVWIDPAIPETVPQSGFDQFVLTVYNDTYDIVEFSQTYYLDPNNANHIRVETSEEADIELHHFIDLTWHSGGTMRIATEEDHDVTLKSCVLLESAFVDEAGSPLSILPTGLVTVINDDFNVVIGDDSTTITFSGQVVSEYDNSSDYTFLSSELEFSGSIVQLTETSNWFNSSWDYRIPINIDNTGNGSTLTNHQVKVTIDTAALVTAGKLDSDCSDIRFTDSDGTTLIDQYKEDACNISATDFWVEVPSIPATSNDTIYIYYGNIGASDVSSVANTFQHFETGSVSLTGTIDNGAWNTVSYINSFTDPVVVAEPIEENNTESASMRLRNLSSSSFDIGIQEPDLDTSHPTESVSYIVVENGQWYLYPSNNLIEADSYSSIGIASGLGSDTYDDIDFQHSYSSAPNVLSASQTINDGSWAAEVIRNITPVDFDSALEVAETGTTHGSETIGWIAIEDLDLTHNGSLIKANSSTDFVRGHNNGCFTVTYGGSNFSATPNLISSQCRRDGGHGGWTRLCGAFVEVNQYNVHIDEDQVNDSERNHTTEAVCWFAADADTTGNLRAYTSPEPSASLGSDETRVVISGTVYNTVPFQPTSVSSWDSFTEAVVLNGQSIDYQLSDDSGSAWYYWDGGVWSSTTTNFNSASVVNSNIGSFPTGANQISVNARLTGNGLATPVLDTVTINFTE